MVFCFVQNFFFGQHKSWNIDFFCPAKCDIFFQNLTLGYVTKTLNQIFFFSSTKIKIFFSATLGIRIFFQKKTITPPFKLNGRSLRKRAIRKSTPLSIVLYLPVHVNFFLILIYVRVLMLECLDKNSINLVWSALGAGSDLTLRAMLVTLDVTHN